MSLIYSAANIQPRGHLRKIPHRWALTSDLIEPELEGSHIRGLSSPDFEDAPAVRLPTLEATGYALMQLEKDCTRYASLLDAFNGFVAHQLSYREVGRRGFELEPMVTLNSLNCRETLVFVSYFL